MLLSQGPTTPTAPDWFVRALAHEATVRTIEVLGVEVSCRSWGVPGTRGVVLVHGGAAHARWWDHVGPLLAETHHVVALDLSGHGDSGHRDAYSLRTWAAEVMAVAAENVSAAPVVIGHSMGGMVALATATWHGEDLAGVVVIDTPVHDATPEEAAFRDKVAFGPRQVFADRAELLARFRVVPAQETEGYIFHHIADHSIRKVEGGWAWKFDPAVFAHEPLRPGGLSRLACPAAMLRPELGLVDATMGDMLADRLGVHVVDVPAAEHHIMLDQPIALVTGLRALLARGGSTE